MEVTVLRSGSRGIKGTYENIECHAKAARSIVEFLEKIINSHDDKIERWRQGHNIHVIESCGRSLAFRPFRSNPSFEVDGVEVSLRLSRKQEIVLCTICNLSEATKFSLWLELFLDPLPNYYKGKDDKDVQ